MAFTAKDVAALREKTGCGMMDCKKALTETDGDMEKAVEFLREKGLAAAAKKAGRIAAEGVVAAVVCKDCNTGVLIEVNSETDFVCQERGFPEFCQELRHGRYHERRQHPRWSCWPPSMTEGSDRGGDAAREDSHHRREHQDSPL